ncbi:hypothetical protein IU459_01920 [Nocardia amamiensis]|uniref:Uncharacterized protein n=1 Tax=Nocardia amamiensis TaxID=404578 RepID=A0ABS0CKF5_9NOCA|nr:hypothetical protein [Nocardia amamiensis]MBF6296298.1 hypothetical protein [Nocardia amamiensis]
MPFLIFGAPPVVVSPMGMNKSGVQSIAGNTTNQKITGWTPRTGYTQTVVTGSELIADGPGPVVVHGRIELTQSWATSSQLSVMVMKNDAQAASAVFVTQTSSLTLPGTPLTLVAGDRVWVRMTNSDLFANATVQTGAGTHLSFDPT